MQHVFGKNFATRKKFFAPRAVERPSIASSARRMALFSARARRSIERNGRSVNQSAARLRGAGQLPPPREFSREQIEAWIADDDKGMRRFREGR